jgi:feruloyl esterase
MKRLLTGAVLALGLGLAAPAAAATCESLTSLKLVDGRVESAAPTAANEMITPADFGMKLTAGAPFCRVKGVLAPRPGSQIGFEVWLPAAASWNGKFLGLGNGGYGGSVNGPALLMRGEVARGYATAATDMGHALAGDIDAKWAFGQPEKVRDFGYRANHLTAEAAKVLIAGCSDGGREALIEAQRFPQDYDAIAAGAPAIPWTGLMSAFLWNDRLMAAPGAAIPRAKLTLIQSAVLAQCDLLDGVKDGVIEDPRACRFDPAGLQCKAGDAADCLTAAQVAAVRGLYRGPTGAGGKSLFPGFTAGGEAVGWEGWITGANASQGRFAKEFFRWMVFADPNWDPASFKIERDLARAKRSHGPILDADNPDLSAFRARGGKLILYHGWSDAAIPAKNTVAYYQSVQAKMGPGTADFARLFLVPGMSHCTLGPGPNVFDVVGPLDAWKDRGAAPERLIATKFDNDIFAYLGLPAKPLRTRPLCAYPKVARWSGSGSTDDAANFSCVAEKPR